MITQAGMQRKKKRKKETKIVGKVQKKKSLSRRQPEGALLDIGKTE